MSHGSASRELTLTAADGFPLAATLFANGQAESSVLIGGALGVPRRYYADFAEWLAQHGAAVLTLDYRGSGDSMHGPIPPRDIRMADWGRQDLQAGLHYLSEAYPDLQINYVGQSAGGQVISLAPSSPNIQRAVFVASQLGDWRVWPHFMKLAMFLLWNAGIPLFSAGRDWFPTKTVGLGKEPIATGIMREWARWGRSKDYLFNPKHGLDFHINHWQAPIRMLAFSDDNFAPEKAARALLKHYPDSVQKDFRLIKPTDSGLDAIGHFGFFRPSMQETLWPLAGEWLLN